MQVPYQIDDFSNVFFQKAFVHLIAIIWSTKYVHFNEVNFIYLSILSILSISFFLLQLLLLVSWLRNHWPTQGHKVNADFSKNFILLAHSAVNQAKMANT